MTYDQIAWFPLCAGVTAAGLVLSFLAFRRRGASAGLRVMAWALLPLAAYLTNAVQALWTIGATVVGFVTSLIFNPIVWSGVAVAGLAAVLFVVSGVMRGRKLSKARAAGKGPAPVTGPPQRPAAGRQPQAGQAPAKPAVAQAKPERKADDDFSDIEDLLKRRGIS